MAGMKKLEVKMPELQYQELKKLQEREGFTTVSELVRTALREHMDKRKSAQVVRE